MSHSAEHCHTFCVWSGLHIQRTVASLSGGQRLTVGLLRQRIIVLQSSSPSYLLMASLDAARAAAAAPGAFGEALAAAAAARGAAGQMARLQVLASGGGAIDSGRPALDPLKLTLGVAGLGISGGLYSAAQCAG